MRSDEIYSKVNVYKMNIGNGLVSMTIYSYEKETIMLNCLVRLRVLLLDILQGRLSFSI